MAERLSFASLSCRGEAGEQPVEVRGDHLGVRCPDPDIELHGKPDVDADGPEAPAGGDRRERAPADRGLHRVPRGLLHQATTLETRLRQGQDEELQHGGGVRRRAVQECQGTRQGA